MKIQKMINKNSGFVNNWIIIAALVFIALIGGLIYYTYYFKNQDIGSLSKNEGIVAPPSIPETNVENQPSVTEENVSQEQPSVIAKVSADKAEYKLNELINTNLLLSLGGKKTPGIDVLLKYDPKFLELQKIAGGALQVSGKVDNPKQVIKTADSSFATFPYLKTDILSGSMFFSALTPAKEDVTGEVNIASIVFKAVKKGTTKISLVFNKNNNQDTGVFYLGKDILDKVVDAEIIVN